MESTARERVLGSPELLEMILGYLEPRLIRTSNLATVSK